AGRSLRSLHRKRFHPKRREERGTMRTIRLVAAATALFGTGLALAGDAPLVEHVDGYPKDFHRGEGASYAVFHKPGAGWHVVVTSGGRRHHFKGKVWIEGEGRFGVIEEWKSAGEVAAELQNENWFHKAIKRRRDDREFTFDIVEESKNVSGINFKVEGPGML